MLPLLTTLAFLAQDPLQIEDAERKYLNRITPEVNVYQDAAPAVVYIRTGGEAPAGFWGRVRRFSGTGSGVVILKEGFIVTNYHVVENAEEILVSFDEEYDDKVYTARLVSFVKSEDLALLKIEGDKDFPVVPLGTSSDLMPGEKVIAIGNPYGQTHTVSTGIISGLHRNVNIPGRGLEFDDLIQTDASINLGNSGGPLLNVNGELIGINSAINTQAENIGFAIPVDRVRQVLDDQLLSPAAENAWLGLEVDPERPLVVAAVSPGGPADSAGIRPGDRLSRLGQQQLADEDSLRLARLALVPGERIAVEVERAGSPRELSVEPWDKFDGLVFDRIGMTVSQVAYGVNRFVRVRDVRAGSPAAELGLAPGDLIEAVRPEGGRPHRIGSSKQLAALVAGLDSGKELEIDLYRDLNADGRYRRDELHRGSVFVP